MCVGINTDDEMYGLGHGRAKKLKSEKAQGLKAQSLRRKAQG